MAQAPKVGRLLAQRALQLGAVGGDTCVKLSRTLIDNVASKNGMRPRDPGVFDAITRALCEAATTLPALTILAVAEQQTGILCSVLVPDARQAEQHVRTLVRAGSARLVPLPPEAIITHRDADLVADQVLECGLFAVTVVASAEGFSAVRVAALKSALRRMHAGLAETDLPPHVVLEALASVSPERRQVVVVDRAHLLGTAQWAALLRLSDNVVAVGCPVLRSVRPGLTLADLFPSAAIPAGASELRALALGPRLPLEAWLRVPTAGSLAEALALPGLLPCALIAVPGHTAGRTAVRAAEMAHGPNEVLVAELAQLAVARDRGPRSLVLFEETLLALSLTDWLMLLVHGWKPSCIVRMSPGAKHLREWVKNAGYFPRKLALHVSQQ